MNAWHRAFGVAAIAASLGLALVAASPAPTLVASLATQAAPITLILDARDASRGLAFEHETIPVAPGIFTVVYPKWIPGEHGPTGPLSDLAQLKFSANGKALAWRRDKVDMYAFHVAVPAGVSSMNADFTVIFNAPDAMSTRDLAILNWNRALLYQADTNAHQVFVKASLLMPNGWDDGTALQLASRVGQQLNFATTPLTTLVDSPFDFGRYYKHIQLWKSGDAEMTLDMFADHPSDLDISKKLLAAYKRVAPEAIALYGGRHWQHYHSLLTLSDEIGFEGIEHHSSSDDRADHGFMTNPLEQFTGGDLLTHEFSHSWNGKYRRPADLTQPNFQIPERTDLLWVYEGMNQYLGDLLSFRAGIRQPKQYPEYLASLYAAMDNEPGRLTTPIIDLTTGAPYYYEARGAYPSLRRTAGDFYVEGELMWLDVDSIIRSRSGGKKSLDTFLHRYAGGITPFYVTKTYTRAQIEGYLQATVPYNWHAFFSKYVYSIAPHPPSGMLARSGWKLVYTAKPNLFISASQTTRHFINDWYSLGVYLNSTGKVIAVRYGSPAWSAGIGPGMGITAINGESFSVKRLSASIKTAHASRTPISLLVTRDGWYSTLSLAYFGGPRYPHLVRIKGRPNMLAKIMAPHAK